MLTIYQSVNEGLEVDDAEAFQWSEPPRPGAALTLGKYRWIAVEIQPYIAQGETVHLVFVARAELPIPRKADWGWSFMKRRSPDISFNVQFSRDREMLNFGWSMDGAPPKILQLHDYIPAGEGMQAKPRPWVIQEIYHYLPQANGLYSAIHLCWCDAVATAA